MRHEDDDVVVVAKPAGLVVHPGAGHPDGTLVNGLLARYPEIAAVGDPARPGHRAPARPRHQRAARRRALDRPPTTGWSRCSPPTTSSAATTRWSGACPTSPRGVIDAPIGRSVRRPDAHVGARRRARWRAPRTRSSTRTASPTWPASSAGSRPVARTRSACTSRPSGTRWWATPPTAGGGRAIALDRPFLHAGGLAFAHPVTGAPVAVEEPLAPELAGSRLSSDDGSRCQPDRRDRRGRRASRGVRRRQSSALGPRPAWSPRPRCRLGRRGHATPGGGRRGVRRGSSGSA